MGLSSLADIFDPPGTQDPIEWTTQRRGAFLWDKQREVAASVRDNRYTAVQSCHGTGKSWLAADLVSWWIDAHPPGEAFVVTTAPTAPQVEAILWREVSIAHEAAGLPGRITWGQVPTWKIGDRMVGYGRKPADYADANKAMQAFQGIHARYVLVILDEACGIPEWLWNAVDTIVTNDKSRCLAIGNPDDPSTRFEKVCRPGSGWNSIKISAFDLPWATGEKVPEYLHDVLTGREWVEERKKRWGEGSPLYQSKVLGEFPDLSDDSLVTPRMIRAAFELDLTAEEIMTYGQMGGDVARMGVDKTVVYRNRAGVVRKVLSTHKQNTMQTAGHFARLLRMHPKVPMWIDTIGIGAGVYDRLHEQGYLVLPYQASEAPIDPKTFYNLRSEDYWKLRGDFEQEVIDMAPDDDIAANELMSMKWDVDSKGRIIVESKKDMRKRGLPSPDHADAIMMSRRRRIHVPDPNDVGGDIPSLTGDLLERQF